METTSLFKPRIFGKTGFEVGPLGVGAGFGIGEKAIEEAYESGVNYFYWAWRRTGDMGRGLRNVCRNNREKVFITITSFLPYMPLLRHSADRARRALGTDYIDGLQFYLMKGKPLWPSQLKPALQLKEEGVIRHIGITGHHRPNFPAFAREEFCDFFHVRYNAIHRGAETEVFSRLPEKGGDDRPGVVAFTVTSWRQLITADKSQLGNLGIPTAGDCYRFALSQAGVDVCLTGPANEEQMRHAIEAVRKGPMTPDELDWMRKVGERLKK